MKHALYHLDMHISSVDRHPEVWKQRSCIEYFVLNLLKKAYRFRLPKLKIFD